MTFSHAYLNAPGDARLVYDVSGGQRERAFPGDAATAVAAEWEADRLTLVCVDEHGGLFDLTLTEQDIEDAKQTEPL